METTSSGLVDVKNDDFRWHCLFFGRTTTAHCFRAIKVELGFSTDLPTNAITVNFFVCGGAIELRHHTPNIAELYSVLRIDTSLEVHIVTMHTFLPVAHSVCTSIRTYTARAVVSSQ